MPLTGFNSLCESRQKIIVSKDGGSQRKHTAENINRAEVTHYRIDGVVLTEGKKCDFLLLNETTSAAYLIELKGRDLTDAASQLESTEAALKNQLKNYILYFRIVSSKSRTHEIESAKFKKFRAAKAGKVNGIAKLIYNTDVINEKI